MPDESPALPAITVSRDVMFKIEGTGLSVVCPSSGMVESVKSTGLSFSHPLSNILCTRE